MNAKLDSFLDPKYKKGAYRLNVTLIMRRAPENMVDYGSMEWWPAGPPWEGRLSYLETPVVSY